MRVVSRCLWDTHSDSSASELYENETLYCVCQVSLWSYWTAAKHKCMTWGCIWCSSCLFVLHTFVSKTGLKSLCWVLAGLWIVLWMSFHTAWHLHIYFAKIIASCAFWNTPGHHCRPFDYHHLITITNWHMLTAHTANKSWLMIAVYLALHPKYVDLTQKWYIVQLATYTS